MIPGVCPRGSQLFWRVILAEVRQVVTLLLDDFHLLTQEEALQEVTEVASVQTELRTCRSQRAQFRFFSGTLMACQASRFYQYLTHLGAAPACPEVKTSLSNSGGAGFILDWAAKIPHVSGPKPQNIKLKQYLPNSIKTSKKRKRQI